jgi:Tfp pilus assembly protein PilF
MIPLLRSALPLLALLALACQKDDASVPRAVVPEPPAHEVAPQARQEAPAPAKPAEPVPEAAPAPSDDLLMAALEEGSPGSVDALVSRTVAYARGGDSAHGLSLLDRALAAKPKEPRFLMLRGRYRLQRHQCEKALWDFENAARFDPKNATAHASVGLARLCIGDGDDAAQAFRKSLEIDPDQPEIRRALAGIAGP